MGRISWMEYHRIESIDDPLFRKMHELMQKVFPPEEVLACELWREPLADPGIRVYVAVREDEVVGATEYRYYPDLEVAMTDFTIIGREGLGIGPFLAERRLSDLKATAAAMNRRLLGTFAEIYDPYQAEGLEFGGIKPMDPFVRREVLAHLGFRKLDFTYVHPSWKNDGEAVSGLDLCFMPIEHEGEELPAGLVVDFLKRYYAFLTNKPQEWLDMVERLEKRDRLKLLPI